MFNTYQIEMKVTLPMPESHWWDFGNWCSLLMNIEANVHTYQIEIEIEIKVTLSMPKFHKWNFHILPPP
ncbi:hypothetical protein BCS86_23900 [Vibrio splendidus]|nr:hypothetical protein BCS86_23900 [Vibrio splendidus]